MISTHISIILALTPLISSADPYTPEMSLRAIASIESSQGRNKAHPVLTRGMHKGSAAAGSWGLMPNTVVWLIRSNPELAQYSYLLELTHDEITAAINSDETLDHALASFYWSKLRRKFSRRRSAFSWFRGEAAGAKASAQDMRNCPYVQKFLRLLEAM